MNTSRLVSQSLRAMVRTKLRSGFIMLGCLIGVAALTFVVSVGTSAEKKMLQTVQRLFSASSVLVSSGGMLFSAGPRDERARMTLEDLESVAALPGVETWDPMLILEGTPVRRGDSSTTVLAFGQSERAERVWERGAAKGEFFDASAVAKRSRVALIGTTVERALFGADDPLGAEIQIGGAAFRVIGVLEAMGTDAHGADRDNEVVVPVSTAMRRLANVDTIRGAKILAKDPARVSETVLEIARVLRERHGIAPGQKDDFTLVTAVDVQKLVAKVQRIFFVFLPLVAAVALLAGGVVAASLMLLSLSERIGEIGLRRAVGARPRDIAAQMLLETTVTTLSGGIGGVLLGAIASLLVAQKMGLPSFFSWKAALLGLALSALTGLAAGVVPSRRAALLQPAEALR
jgi:putative ABC transport system permease protein